MRAPQAVEGPVGRPALVVAAGRRGAAALREEAAAARPARILREEARPLGWTAAPERRQRAESPWRATRVRASAAAGAVAHSAPPGGGGHSADFRWAVSEDARQGREPLGSLARLLPSWVRVRRLASVRQDSALGPSGASVAQESSTATRARRQGHRRRGEAPRSPRR